MNKTQNIDQKSLRPTWVSTQATAWPFPRADAASTQPQGRLGKHFMASKHEGSML